MNNSFTLQSQLLNDIDEIKISERALDPHFANGCDIYTRERYAGLLAVALLTQGSISEQQSRLFRLILGSLELADTQGRLFGQARETNQDTLLECARLFDEQHLALSFFVDAAVLLRLAGPLPDEQQQLLCELADLFDVLPPDLALAADLAAIILGMEPANDIPPQFDYAIVNMWQDFLYRPLTEERLLSGALNGWWRISEPLMLNKSWSMTGVRLRFDEGGCIETKTDELEQVTIVDCNLENPVMIFGNSIVVRMADTTISGVYAESAKITAITLGNRDADMKQTTTKVWSIFSNLKVSTKNARSFLVFNSPSKFDCCQFSFCGNTNLTGGAIHADVSDGFLFFDVDNSRFLGCLARVGGGIKVGNLYTKLNYYRNGHFWSGVKNTEFDSCVSIAYQPKGINVDSATFAFGGGAMFISGVDGNGHSAIESCKFINTSIQLGVIEGDSFHMSGCEMTSSLISFRGNTLPRVYNLKHLGKYADESLKSPIKGNLGFQSWWDEY